MADAWGVYNYYDPNRPGWQAPQSGYSPDVAGLLDAHDDPGAVIRALAAEANELAVPQEPTVMDALTTLAPTHRRKLPGRAASDARRQHFMDRALEVYGRPQGDQAPSTWAALPEQMQADLLNYATNKDGFRDSIANPYEYTGIIGPGSRLAAAGKWLQSIPTMGYQASHMLANAVGNVMDGHGGGVKTTAEAADAMADAGGTALAPVTSMLGVSGAPTAWSRSREVREAADEQPQWWLQDSFVIDNRPAQQRAAAREGMAGGQEDGEELLTSYGVDDVIGKLPTRIWGGVLDDTLNPLWDGAAIVGAARAGKTAAAMRGLALEHAPSAILGGYTTYLENEADKNLKRVSEAWRQAGGR